MSRLLISGTNSGCGKTTMVCGILSALKARGKNITAFKSGPDYIDPMFHRAIVGINSYNLDPFFLDGAKLRASLGKRGGEISIIEGAMGYYDGIASSDEASAYTVAKETKTPVVLVVSAKGAANSLGAIIEGFLKYRPDSQIKGVLFNEAREQRYPDLYQIAKNVGIPAYGYLPRCEKWTIESRQLGLLSSHELGDLKERLLAIGEQAEKSIDIDGLLELANTATSLQAPIIKDIKDAKNLRLAIAQDEAFCFHYQENLELLQSLGCELVFFSPLRDKELPTKIDGLYLSGGYQGRYKKILSENINLRNKIKQKILQGLPIIAEGGGFLYLHDSLDGVPMCGVIEAAAFETKKLQRFGYITLVAEEDNLLSKKGETIPSHEFHYWDSYSNGTSYRAIKAGRDISYPCVHGTETMYAGFPYLYLPGNENFAKGFVERMTEYAR